jgi:hypothetical protein
MDVNSYLCIGYVAVNFSIDAVVDYLGWEIILEGSIAKQ